MPKLNIKTILLGLFVFVVIYLVGGLTWASVEKAMFPTEETEKPSISLPTDLVKISGCVPFEGEHWVSPKDVEHGPYYVIYNGKLMAIEYMFTQDDIAGEEYARMTPDQLVAHMQTNKLQLSDVVDEIRSFNFDTFGAEIKYLDIHWTSPHAGVVEPHYDMHLYVVDKSEMDTVCPEATLEEVITPRLIEDIIDSGIPFPGVQ